MKYIAAILVALAFYGYYVISKPKEAPLSLQTEVVRPGELSSVEKDYYIKVFDYAMTVVEPGKSYDWQGHFENRGKITVDEPFQSKSSSTCRNFSETFTIGGIAGKSEGVACKRNGDDGWCRLKKTDALTCALETPGTMVGFDFPGGNYNGPNVNVGIGGINTPGVHAPTAPGVNTDAPNSKGAGKGYAETVTGTAGSAAGPVTKGAKDWFNDVFR